HCASVARNRGWQAQAGHKLATALRADIGEPLTGQDASNELVDVGYRHVGDGPRGTARCQRRDQRLVAELPGEGGNVEAEGLRHRSKAGVDARVELKRIDDQRGVDVEEIGRRGDPAEQPGDGGLTSIAENVAASRKADETFTG